MKTQMKWMSFLLLGLMGISGSVQSTITSTHSFGIREEAKDVASKEEGVTFHRNLMIGEDATTDVSPMFVQGAEGEDAYRVRFATAVKGDITSVAYTRDEVLTLPGKSKSVTTLYRGIEAAGEVYYYSSGATTANHLTTNVDLSGEYYWACYTISIANEKLDTYLNEEIHMTLKVNDTLTVDRTVTVNEVKNGMSDAPMTLEEKYGNRRKGDLASVSQVKKTSMFFGAEGRGYFYEAEYAELSSGIKIENKKSASNGRNIGGFKGRTMTFTIDSLVESDVSLQIRLTNYGNEFGQKLPSEVFQVEYGSDLENLIPAEKFYEDSIGNIGTWDWTNSSKKYEYQIAEIHLNAGINILKITGLCTVNIDYIALAKPIAESETLQEKYGSFVKGDLLSGERMVFADAPRGYFYEAESLAISTGVNTEYKNFASNNVNIGSFEKGRTLTLRVESEVEEDVAFGVKQTNWWSNSGLLPQETFTVEYGVDEENLTASEHYFEDKLGSLNTWDWGVKNKVYDYQIAEVHLAKGVNFIRLISSNHSVNIDYVTLQRAVSTNATDLKTKYGSVQKELLESGNWTNVLPTSNAGFYFEAEHADLSLGIGCEAKSLASNGQNIGSFEQGRTMTYHFMSEIETDVAVKMAFVCWNGGFTVQEAFTIRYGVGSDSSSWQNATNYYDTSVAGFNTWDWKEGVDYEFHIAEIHISKGMNYIQIASSKPVNVDYVCLVKPL